METIIQHEQEQNGSPPLSAGLESAAHQRRSMSPLPLSPRLSRKLRIISFCSILIILLNHAANYEVLYGGNKLVTNFAISDFLQRLVRDGLGRVNRPMFFFISGFLFFWTLEPQAAGFVRKFKRRFVSLVIPYLLWSLAGMAVWLVLSAVPAGQNFLGRHAPEEFFQPQALRILLLDPVPYQLWFLRDLIFWVLLSPVIYFAAARCGWFTLIPVVMFWFSNLHLPDFGLSSSAVFIFEKNGFCFFIFGAVVAHRRWDLEEIPSKHGTLWLCLWALFAVGYVSLVQFGDRDFRLLQQLSMLAGMLALWVNYDRLPAAWRERILPYSFYTFFIYVFHEPLLTALKKLFFCLMPMTPATSLAAFVFLPAVVIVVCLWLGARLKNNFPKTYSVLTGGR